MPGLGWQHHTLIQSLLSRGPTSEMEFHKMFEGVSKKNPVTHPRIFNDVLLKINKELSYVQFELRGCRNQYNGEVYYGVVNNVADEQSKLGTKYSIPQIAFYKGIIEAIVKDASAQGCISSIDALNIRLESQCSCHPLRSSGLPLLVMTATNSESQGGGVPTALKHFSISQKEKTLDEFVRDKWLCFTSDGYIGLGIRSFLDLRSWFRSNDIPACEVCNEPGLKAELCRNPDCNARIHQHCLKKKFSQTRAEKVCPRCQTPWPYVMTKAEALEEVEETNEPTQTKLPDTQPAAGPSRKRLRSKSERMGDDVTGASQPSSQPSTRTTRRSSRLR
ncbi:unnamed protein product [Rhodiola kirilowii]